MSAVMTRSFQARPAAATQSVLKLLLRTPDRIFLNHIAVQLGTSKSEFVRRLIDESRMRCIEAGLYTMPPPRGK
jgi:hypothetical protein